MKTANPILAGVARTLAVGLVLVVSAPLAAQPATPKDPKSPVPGFADGRGPSGPVTLRIVAPKGDEIIPIPAPAAGQPAATGAPVEVRVELTGYETFQNPDSASGPGQYIGLMLDNFPTVFAYYDIAKPWLFKRIPKGTHTLRAFPVRPWGEAIKDPSAFAIVTFHVGEKDGRNMAEPGTPVLTVVSPHAHVKGEGGRVLLDVLVTGCPVAESTVPDTCRLRYKLDTQPEVTLTKVEPVWLENVTPGRHAYVVGLTREQKVVPGAFALYQGSFEVDGGAPPAPPGSAPDSASPPKSPGR